MRYFLAWLLGLVFGLALSSYVISAVSEPESDYVHTYGDERDKKQD